MWGRILSFTRFLLNLSDRLDEQTEDLRDLQTDVRNLTRRMDALAAEMQQFQSEQRKDNELLLLRLENELLKFERGLPPRAPENE